MSEQTQEGRGGWRIMAVFSAIGGCAGASNEVLGNLNTEFNCLTMAFNGGLGLYSLYKMHKAPPPQEPPAL